MPNFFSSSTALNRRFSDFTSSKRIAKPYLSPEKYASNASFGRQAAAP
jgi:hypothetical protein